MWQFEYLSQGEPKKSHKPINPYLFRIFWMWTHFVLVPSLQSLLVRLQSHPMVQQCTQGAPTTNSWRTRNLKRCSALCGRPPSLTLSRDPQIGAETHGRTIFGRKLGTDRSNSCELGRVEEGDLCSRSGQHRSWYSPCNFETSSWGLGVTFPDYPGFVLACHSKFWQENAFGVSRSDGYFTCQTGTENPFLLNSSLVNGPASSTFAVVMRANMQNIENLIWIGWFSLRNRLTWWMLDGPGPCKCVWHLSHVV